MVTHSTLVAWLCVHCKGFRIIFLTTDKLFAQNKFYKYLKTYPFLIKIRNLRKLIWKCRFSRQDKIISRKKNHSLFVFLLGASYMQKGGEMKVSSLAEEIWFRLIFLDVSSYNLFRILVFVVTTRRAPVNRISCLFRWSSSCKKAIITYHCWLWHTVFLRVWRLHVKLTKNTSSHSQLSYKLGKKKHCKVNYINSKKKAERNTRKKFSRTYHLIMSIFSLFHFVASMKTLASIRE